MFIILMNVYMTQTICTKIFVREDGMAVMIIPDQILKVERKVLPAHPFFNRSNLRQFCDKVVDKQKEKMEKEKDAVFRDDDNRPINRHNKKQKSGRSKDQQIESFLEECYLFFGCSAFVIILILATEVCRYMKRRRIKSMEKYQIGLPVFPKSMYDSQNVSK